MSRFGNPFAWELLKQRSRALQALRRRPFLATNATFPETDTRYVHVKDQQPDSVIEAIIFLGFCCEQRKPYAHWVVVNRDGKSEVPPELSGAYVNRERLINAIDDFCKKEKKGHEAPHS